MKRVILMTGVALVMAASVAAGAFAHNSPSAMRGVGAQKVGAFTWAANAWGECNTARPPVPPEYAYLFFNGIVVTPGRPSNFYTTQCKYTAVATRGFQTVLMRSVNWSRACAIDAAGLRYHVSFRVWDATYWCVLG
jgi:hypothetical protein